MSRLLYAIPLLALTAAPVSAADPAQDMTARMDRYLAERWAQAGVQPAAPADDATFMRRVYLDLLGRIPTVPEAREFLGDKTADKRPKLIQKLLDSPGSSEHFARVWRHWLLPDPNSDQVAAQFAPGFEEWLKQRLAANAGYDKIARDLLTAVGPTQNGARKLGGRAAGGQVGGPAAFILALENKPENLAGRTARVFLGAKLECAECHDHPHAPWTQDQFWGYAAFFASRRDGMRIPNTDRTAAPRFPDGTTVDLENKNVNRTAVADWLTRPDNRFFARAAVNRMWGYFFGLGLVEPFDDFQDQASPAFGALLDDLAKEFATHEFDLKLLSKALVMSRAYQLSSGPAKSGPDEPQGFARRSVKGLSAEQFFDSLVQATGAKVTPPMRAEVLGRFAVGPEKPVQAQTSLLQALALMNGRLVADATSADRGGTLAAVADAPFLSVAEKIETLYLAALSRPPKPDELREMTKYVEAGGPRKDQSRALADLFWALLNSGEFLLNH